MMSEQFNSCSLLHEPIERCKDCGLLHDPWSDNTQTETDSINNIDSFLSMEQNSVKPNSSRCQLRQLPVYILSDNDTSDSFSSNEFLNGSVEWNSFLIQAHSTNNLNWICSWVESHNQVHETSFVDVPRHQPTTLVASALQVLDNAGHLDFNIQDPCSLEGALNQIGFFDGLPIKECHTEQKKVHKKVSFYLPEDDVGLEIDTRSCRLCFSQSYKEDQVFVLGDILKQALSSLSPIQNQAIDVLKEQSHMLNHSPSRPSDETLGIAISNMSPLQSLAVAVKAGYVEMKILPVFVDSDFIRKNMS